MNITRLFRRRHSAAKKTRPFGTRLHLEVLEDRTLLAGGLVAAYSFAEGSGAFVADASGTGNPGTISNATWVAGKYGNGLKFTGNTLFEDVGFTDAVGVGLLGRDDFFAKFAIGFNQRDAVLLVGDLF